jgi:hypothetical protein
MDVAPRELAWLTRHASTLVLMPRSLRSCTPIIVTDSAGKPVKASDRCGIAWLPRASEAITSHPEQIREPMAPAVHTTAAEQVGHIPRPAHKGPRRFKMAAQAPHGAHARRHDFGIAHLLVRGFGMAARVQAICPQAIPGQDRVVPGGLVVQERRESLPLSLEDEAQGCQ